MDKRRAIFLSAVGIFETGAYRLYRSLDFFQKRNIADFKTGFLPFAGILAVAGFLLVLQRDVGTLGVIIISCVALFFLGGGKIKHLLVGLVIIGIALASLVYFEPYRMKRITVFLNPSYDPQGAGYQLRQSLIAIGAGGITGKGFGMSAKIHLFARTGRRFRLCRVCRGVRVCRQFVFALLVFIFLVQRIFHIHQGAGRLR